MSSPFEVWIGIDRYSRYDEAVGQGRGTSDRLGAEAAVKRHASSMKRNDRYVHALTGERATPEAVEKTLDELVRRAARGEACLLGFIGRGLWIRGRPHLVLAGHTPLSPALVALDEVAMRAGAAGAAPITLLLNFEGPPEEPPSNRRHWNRGTLGNPFGDPGIFPLPGLPWPPRAPDDLPGQAPVIDDFPPAVLRGQWDGGVTTLRVLDVFTGKPTPVKGGWLNLLTTPGGRELGRFVGLVGGDSLENDAPGGFPRGYDHWRWHAQGWPDHFVMGIGPADPLAYDPAWESFPLELFPSQQALTADQVQAMLGAGTLWSISRRDDGYLDLGYLWRGQGKATLGSGSAGADLKWFARVDRLLGTGAFRTMHQPTQKAPLHFEQVSEVADVACGYASISTTESEPV